MQDIPELALQQVFAFAAAWHPILLVKARLVCKHWQMLADIELSQFQHRFWVCVLCQEWQGIAALCVIAKSPLMQERGTVPFCWRCAYGSGDGVKPTFVDIRAIDTSLVRVYGIKRDAELLIRVRYEWDPKQAPIPLVLCMPGFIESEVMPERLRISFLPKEKSCFEAYKRLREQICALADGSTGNRFGHFDEAKLWLKIPTRMMRDRIIAGKSRPLTVPLDVILQLAMSKNQVDRSFSDDSILVTTRFRLSKK